MTLDKVLSAISWVCLTLAAFVGFVDALSVAFAVTPQSGWVWLVAFGAIVMLYSLYSFTIAPLRAALRVRQVWCPGCGNKHEPPLCED